MFFKIILFQMLFFTTLFSDNILKIQESLLSELNSPKGEKLYLNPVWIVMNSYELEISRGLNKKGEVIYKKRGIGTNISQESNYFLSQNGAKNPKHELEMTIKFLFNENTTQEDLCRYVNRLEYLRKYTASYISEDYKCKDFDIFYQNNKNKEMYYAIASPGKSIASQYGHSFFVIANNVLERDNIKVHDELYFSYVLPNYGGSLNENLEYPFKDNLGSYSIVRSFYKLNSEYFNEKRNISYYLIQKNNNMKLVLSQIYFLSKWTDTSNKDHPFSLIHPYYELSSNNCAKNVFQVTYLALLANCNYDKIVYLEGNRGFIFDPDDVVKLLGLKKLYIRREMKL